jgi:hypothetical protein
LAYETNGDEARWYASLLKRIVWFSKPNDAWRIN